MNKSQITLYNSPLFTKISLATPSDKSLDLPSEACFVFIVKGDDQVFSFDQNIKASNGHVILSLCGLTVGNMLASLSKGYLETIIVHFNLDLLNNVFGNNKPEFWHELESPVSQYVVQSEANNLIESYFKSIDSLFSNTSALDKQFLAIKLQEIIILLLKSDNSKHIRKIINSLFSEKEFSFKELVDAHIDTTDSIENLAILTHNSLSTFKRKFKKVYQTTPSKYKVKKNTEKVAKLLRISDKSITSIGYECGFKSPSHLSRAFKNRFGLTPSEYRLNYSDK
jgi:AraC-like DNA-binding protein